MYYQYKNRKGPKTGQLTSEKILKIGSKIVYTASGRYSSKQDISKGGSSYMREAFRGDTGKHETLLICHLKVMLTMT